MTMTDDDTELDRLFAQARQERSQLPDDLAVRMMTDAESVRLGRLAPQTEAKRRSWWHLFDNVGGWQGMGGLVAASAAGVWIGFSAPSFLPDPANYLISQETAYLVADLGLDTAYLEDAE